MEENGKEQVPLDDDTVVTSSGPLNDISIADSNILLDSIASVSSSLDEFVQAVLKDLMSSSWPQPELAFHCHYCNYQEFENEDMLNSHKNLESHKRNVETYDVAFCTSCQYHAGDKEGINEHDETEKHKMNVKRVEEITKYTSEFWKNTAEKSDRDSMPAVKCSERMKFILDTFIKRLECVTCTLCNITLKHLHCVSSPNYIAYKRKNHKKSKQHKELREKLESDAETEIFVKSIGYECVVCNQSFASENQNQNIKQTNDHVLSYSHQENILKHFAVRTNQLKKKLGLIVTNSEANLMWQLPLISFTMDETRAAEEGTMTHDVNNVEESDAAENKSESNQGTYEPHTSYEQIENTFSDIDVINVDQETFILMVFERVMEEYWPKPISEFYCRCCNYKEFSSEQELDAHKETLEHVALESNLDTAFCLACQVHAGSPEKLEEHNLVQPHWKYKRIIAETKKYARVCWDHLQYVRGGAQHLIQRHNCYDEYIRPEGCLLCKREFYIGCAKSANEHKNSKKHQAKLHAIASKKKMDRQAILGPQTDPSVLSGNVPLLFPSSSTSMTLSISSDVMKDVPGSGKKELLNSDSNAVNVKQHPQQMVNEHRSKKRKWNRYSHKNNNLAKHAKNVNYYTPITASNQPRSRSAKIGSLPPLQHFPPSKNLPQPQNLPPRQDLQQPHNGRNFSVAVNSHEMHSRRMPPVQHDLNYPYAPVHQNAMNHHSVQLHPNTRDPYSRYFSNETNH